MTQLYEFSVKSIEGKDISLSQYKGQVLLIVNTASRCGFTGQYEGLEALYARYHSIGTSPGFQVLAFPCNQFGAQEPGSSQEIASFCQINYKTSFPLFEKIEVNGDHANPLFKYLKSEAPGLLGSEGIKWNFTKFLVGKDGKVIKRYAPQDKPESIAQDIEEAMK